MVLSKATYFVVFMVLGLSSFSQSRYKNNQWYSYQEPPKKQVTTVAFSPDSKKIVIGYANGNLKLWDINTGKTLRKYKRYKVPLVYLAYSPDGTKILAGFEEFSGSINVRLWDANSNKVLNEFNGGSESISYVDFSPDSRKMVIGNPGDGQIGVWNLLEKKPLKEFYADQAPQAGVFLNNTQIVFSSSYQLSLWDFSSKKVIQKISYKKYEKGDKFFENISNFSIAPNQKQVLIGNESHPAKLWSLSSGKLIHTFGKQEKKSVGIFSPNGRLIATYDDSQQLKIWNAKNQKLVKSVNIKSRPAQIEFSPDSKHLLIVGKTAQVMNAKTGKVKYTLAQATPIKEAWYSPNGEMIATRDKTKQVSLWSTENGKLIQKF